MKIERKKEIDVIRISHNKKLFWIIIALIILLIVLIYFIAKNNKINDTGAGNNINECKSDSDCFAASCCHADSCVPANKKPDCSGIFCSMDCESVLDCGAGHCSCINGKCNVVSEI